MSTPKRAASHAIERTDFVVVAAPLSGRKQERARRKCFEALLPALIRMEEGGFLEPYHVDPDTGYRYYDMQNVAAIGQYQRLQSIGLSRSEIADVYFGRVDSAEFIARQRRKLESMRRFLNEYEMSRDRSRNRMSSYAILPPRDLLLCRGLRAVGGGSRDASLRCPREVHGRGVPPARQRAGRDDGR